MRLPRGLQERLGRLVDAALTLLSHFAPVIAFSAALPMRSTIRSPSTFRSTAHHAATGRR